MIVDLHKYLLCGKKSEMDRFFALAQKAGFMEFIGLSHKKALEMPENAKLILSAIKIVRAHTAPAHSVYHPTQDPVALAESIVALNSELERLQEEKRILRMEIARTAPFGDFSREELELFEKESKRVVQFFILKNEQAREWNFPDELIYLTSAYDLSYFVAINRERVQYPKMTEVLIDRPVGRLRKEAKRVDQELERCEKQIHDSARAQKFLQEGLLEYLNEYELTQAKHAAAAPLGDSLFAIEAWVPKTKIKALSGLLSGLDVFAEEVKIEETDRVPTCMENRGVSRLGEDLVQVYDTPASDDVDPSLWVVIFFTFFFAIIISDAGYGLIYLAAGLWMKYKIPNPSAMVRRFTKIVLLVSSACIVWGVLTVSFFGISIAPDSSLRKISFIHYMATKKADYHIEHQDNTYQEYAKICPAAKEASNGKDFLVKTTRELEGSTECTAMNDFYDAILMELSLFIGMVHIALSFLRYLRRNWAGFGWVLFLVGGYLYFPEFVNATSFVNYLGWMSKPTGYALGKQLFYSGLTLVGILSLIQKRSIGGALHELTNSIQVFGDVLSYLRLYALALAGMMMASTFNELAVQSGIFGVFIIIGGHAVNMLLAVMSGTIHGLRLNFLEWYHYCFEGGGRTFNPLRIRKVK